jgi:basic membrane protein A
MPRIRTPRPLVAVGAAAASVVLLAGCAAAPAATSAAHSSYTPCIVSDGPTFNDHSFNELSLGGVTDAAAKLGGSSRKVTSASANDYSSNVRSLVNAKCNVIVAPGYQLAAAVKASATSSPKTDFIMVDDDAIKRPNVKPIVFRSDEAGFLGGYLAAAYSKTGVVATWGGANIPTVTIYMDGIAEGVAYYDQQEHKDVKLLGWNETTQQGTFVGNFSDQNQAKTITANMLQQDADVVIPIAGPLYQGAGAAIRSAGASAVLEGVDADLYQTDTAGYQDLILTSILKNVRPSVSSVIEKAASTGKFDNSPYIGTLKNGGVGLAPFHDFSSKVPSSLSSTIDKVKQEIIDGSITVTSPSDVGKN